QGPGGRAIPSGGGPPDRRRRRGARRAAGAGGAVHRGRTVHRCRRSRPDVRPGRQGRGDAAGRSGRVAGRPGGPTRRRRRRRRDRRPGGLDPTFGTGGRVWTDLATLATPLRGAVAGDVALGSSSASAVVVQPDGRIVVGGSTQSGGSTAFAILRYLPDGRPDPSFGSDGLTVTDFDPATNDAIRSLALLPDGRIVAAGVAGDAAALARYRPDGQLDTTFGDARDGTVT